MRMSSEHNMDVVQSIQKDMSSLLRRIKQQQEDHCRVFQYCNRIILRREQITDDIYIHDEIMKIKSYVQQKHNVCANHQQLDNQLCSKYDIMSQINQIIYPVFKKVAFKVIQLLSSGVESLKEPPEYYTYVFTNFKAKFLDFNGNQINHLNVSQMVKNISDYLQNKINVQLQRLRQLIASLQLSDHKAIEDLRQSYYKRLKQKQYKKAQQCLDNSYLYNKVIQKKSSIIKNIYSERDIKIQRPKLIKYDEKKKVHHKKLQLKKLKKYVQNLFEVMQISKEQLLQEMTSQSKQWQSKRMYIQLCGRNKHNLTQISQFSDRTSHFQDIVKLNQEVSLFVKHQQSIITLQDELLKKQVTFLHKQYPVKERDHIEQSQKCILKKQINIERKQTLKMKTRLINKKQKMQGKEKGTQNKSREGMQNRIKQIFNSQKYSESNDFIEIDIKQQQPRQRLPDIYLRATSVDNNKFLKKQSINNINKNDQKALKSMKQQFLSTHQINFKMPNRSQLPARNSLSEKHCVKAKPPNVNKEEMRGKQKMEQKIRLQLRTMGTNFFQEIGKKISKFCDMKKNSDF